MPTNNSAAFDYPENFHVNKYFVISSIPRSGSTLLCRGLWDTGLAGAPKEYFHHKHMEEFRDRWSFQNLAGYIEKLKRFRTSPNGVFGFKIHFDQFDSVLKDCDIEQYFPDMHYILVKRRDHLRQAISLSKAVQTMQWSIDDRPVGGSKYDPNDIRKRMQIIKQMEQDWEQFFKERGIKPIIVTYEDLANKYPQVIKSVMTFLGINLTETFKVIPSRLKKLSNAETEVWVKRFKSEEGNGLPKFSVRSDEKPRISVEMGCYNFENYIAEAIESVLAQKLTPYELIISDDHSTDNSWEIIQFYTNKYPDLIRSFRTSENKGMKRCGIMRKNLVRGELLSTIDGDDRWLPRKLEFEWEALKEHPDAKLAYSNVYIIDESGKRTDIWYDRKGVPPPSGDVFIQTFGKRFFKNNRNVFRNHLMYCDVLKEIGYKDLDDNLMHPDWDKKIRMTAKYGVVYSGHALVEYRNHRHGIHHTRAEKLFRSQKYVIQKNHHLLKNRSNAEIKYVEENLKSLLLNSAASANIDSSLIDFPKFMGLDNSKAHAVSKLKQTESRIAIPKSRILHNSIAISDEKCTPNRKIAHIVNPVLVPIKNPLFFAQSVTFETIRRAKEFSKDKVNVSLFAANFIEDKDIVPEYFRCTKELCRSIIDVKNFQIPRKLPFIIDILDRLYEKSEAEYLIYTNIDIALMPNFYIAVNEIIDEGYDAFVINRRTIPDTYNKITQIKLMYDEIGELHPGYDCFVFRRDAYPKFRLKNICIGINYVGLALLKNLEGHSKKFKVFEDLHLTFHLGNDKPWKKDEYKDYRKHNELEYKKILEDLEKELHPVGAENTKPVSEKKNECEKRFPIKLSKLNKFNQVREKNIFFILSSGRSGTKTIAKSLSKLPDCLCLHEPAPQLILESSAYRYGRLDGDKLKEFIIKTRNPVIKGKVYGESNQTLSLIVPVLAKSFRKGKFIWLTRNGLDVVSSIFARQWYTGHSANHDRYEACPPLEKAWIDGRIMGDLCGDVPFAKWKSMNPFARCCWYWAYINLTIERDLRDHCSVGSYNKIKLEELYQDLPTITEWLGFGYTPDQKIGRHNRAHYKLYPWQKWTSEERKTFIYWCGPLMDRLYPDWRILLRGFFNDRYDTPDTLILPEGKKLKNQTNLHEISSFKTNLKELNIYYTPQIKSYPKISVYIPSYNQKEYLVEAIESVLAQTLKPHQIIIVDDFSNDGSQEIIAKYAHKYPSLIYPIYHAKNFGVVQTRLDALNAVTGDYVTYVDGDDRFLPEKIECEFDILTRNPNARIAYSNNYYINPVGQRTGIWAEREKPPQGYIFKETFGRRFPKSSLFRMELVNYQAWKSVGFHDPAITIYEDFDMRIRMTKHFQVAFCDKPLSEIRLHEKGLSNLKAKQHLTSLEFVYHKNRSLLGDLNESDREKVKKGFFDFVNNISLEAANQLAEDQKIKKQKTEKISHERIGAKLTKDQPNRLNELGNNLIFLISQPRAGSTLFQRLLAGHPEIHTTSEPWLMLHPLYALKENGITTEYRSDLALQGLKDFLMQVPEGIELYKNAIRKFGSTLYYRLLEMSGKRFFLDKTPRYYHIIPELFSVFPEANFIFLLRNPVAVLSSVLKTWFGNCADDLQIQNLIDLVKGPVHLLDGIKTLKEKAIVVDYETLVKSPEIAMHRVCNRIGIPYYGNMIEYGRNPKPKGRFGDPVGIYKHSRPVAENIDKWQKNISSPEFVEISNQYLETLGSDIVSKMGYNFKELKQKLKTQSRYNNPIEPKFNEIEALNKEGQNLLAKGDLDVASDFQKAPLPAAGDRLGPEEIKTASKEYVITAIVSTYNSERFIRGCLEDLENQTIADRLEIVVVNSGSQQNEEMIIKEFQKRYSNIKYIRTENRETVYQAWNRGIRAASGSYITNANTDDRHRPDAFEIMARALEENSTVGAVYADNLISDKENETFENNSAKQYFKRPNFSLRQMLLFSFFGPQPMWRRSIHRKIGYFDENLSVAADYDFFIRLSREFGALHIGKNLGLYTRRSLSIENSNREKCVSETRQVLKRYRHIIPLEELYPDLKFEKEQGKARAACLADQGNCCLFGGIPDIKGTLAYYNRSLEHGYSGPELAANLGVALLLSGNQSQGVEVLRRIAGRVRSAAQNLAIIERCLQKGELPQVGRFKAAEIHHPVVSAATLGKGVAIEKNRFIPVETAEKHWAGSDMVRNLLCKTDGMVTSGSLPALVSVIVPTFNRRHILKETLGSILSQTYPDFEIIVVNDGGEDVSELIQNFQDPRIKYFQQKSHKGPAAARNTGIKSAKGKYIAYLDDDDFFYPNHLETLVQYLENSNYKVAYTDAYRVHQEKRGNHYITIKRDLPHSFDFDRDKFLVNNYIPILCFMHEKSCLENIGFFDETLSTHEDWDLWIRLSRGYKFVHIKKVTAGFTWRKDGTSTTSKHRPDFLLTMEKVYQKHEKYVEHKPHLKLAQIRYLQEWRGKISGAQSTVRCSIIIPVFNQIKYTKHCLETLFKNTPPELFETIVIDNHSTDGTREYLKNLKEKVKVITNSENFGFAKACNQGAKAASGEYVLFLNNDTKVEPGWLNALIEVLDKDRTVAAVGSKLLFPDKTIQHAGVLVINDQKFGDPLVARHIYYQQNENYPKANQICIYQALTAACLIVRKSAFEAVDGFDESYWNGYEDIDLCFKFQQKGWLLVYQPKSVVIHYESQSGPERFRQFGHNIERLHQKWLNKVAPDWIIDANGLGTETNPRRIRPYFIPTNHTKYRQDSKVSFEKLISIVILTHNQLEYTQKCIESVFEHTKEHFELIVVDNGSSDGTVEYLQSKLRDRRPEIRIKILQNKNNLGFAAGNNQGIATARGDYILLMNNDIVATPGWLERMVSCAERDPRIGIVGPTSNSVSGPQQVKDVTYNITGLDGLNDFAAEFSKRNAGKAKRIMRVVGFCMLIKRAVVDKIGGLDSRYGLGNFEDDDFSLRAALAGFESWMADDCFIHHFGNRTFIGAKIDYNASLTKNWEIFKNKWSLSSSFQLGSKYSWAQILKEGFVREKHCCPLNQGNYVETMQKDVSSLLPDAGSLKELYQKVQRLVNDGRQEEAVGELERLLEMDPEFAMAHNDLGILYYNQGDKEKALNHYEQAVRIDPHNLTFQKNLADFYFVESGRVEDALAIYNKVLEVDFGDVEALMAMGLICTSLGRPEDAMHFYNRVLENEPWNVDARLQLENLYPN